jgi:hypothetical protein
VTVIEGIIEIVGAGDGTAVGEATVTGEGVGVGSSMTVVGVSVGTAVGVAWPQLISTTVAKANRTPLTNRSIDFTRLSFLFPSFRPHLTVGCPSWSTGHYHDDLLIAEVADMVGSLGWDDHHVPRPHPLHLAVHLHFGLPLQKVIDLLDFGVIMGQRPFARRENDLGQTVTAQGRMAGPGQFTDDFAMVGNQWFDLIAMRNVHRKLLRN